MILSDFHTHTNFVDGENTAEEMVMAASAMGLSAIGFSEHAYCPPDPGCSLSPQGTLAYRFEIARLAEKYQDEITVLCGIELDADSPDFAEPYDYVISSVHYLTANGKTYSIDNTPKELALCVREGFGGDFDALAEAYFEKLTRAVERSHATIVGHFDLITKFKELGVAPDETSPRYRAAWQKALAALAGKAVMEVNVGAMTRKKRTTPYPSDEILAAWHALGGKILLSGDAHTAASLCAGFADLEAPLRAMGFTEAGFTDAAGRVFRQF